MGSLNWIKTVVVKSDFGKMVKTLLRLSHLRPSFILSICSCQHD